MRLVSLLLLIGSLSLGTPVAAHHVGVAAVTSDADAFSSAQAEYQAQWDTLLMAWAAFEGTVSISETEQTLLDLEGALTTTLEHLDSLDVRPCFERWMDVARTSVEAQVAAVWAYRNGHDIRPSLISSGWLKGLATDTVYFLPTIDCAEDESLG